MVCITSRRLVYRPINGSGLLTNVLKGATIGIARPLLHKGIDAGLNWIGSGRNYSTSLTGGRLMGVRSAQWAKPTRSKIAERSEHARGVLGGRRRRKTGGSVFLTSDRFYSPVTRRIRTTGSGSRAKPKRKAPKRRIPKKTLGGRKLKKKTRKTIKTKKTTTGTGRRKAPRRRLLGKGKRKFRLFRIAI